MIGWFDVENLDKLLKDFYTAVGIRISVFDENFNLVTEYPKEAPLFCSLVRESEAGREGCRACDEAACRRAKKLREPHLYRCHAGLQEAITPIVSEGGIVGYAILAHIMPEENYAQAVNEACALAAKYGADAKACFDAVTQIRPRSEKQIHACVHLLDAVATYVYSKNLAAWKKEDISRQIDLYMRQNLDKDLGSDALCRKFLVSRTKLYQIAAKSFGLGISQYAAHLRIEEAKRLLLSGASIAETAEKTGFSDYNYFCKAFKRAVGRSPAKFRAGV